MREPDTRSGSEEFNEGYRLSWNEDGIEIRTTEYHPLPLRLSWDFLASLMGRAKGPKAAPDKPEAPARDQ